MLQKVLQSYRCRLRTRNPAAARCHHAPGGIPQLLLSCPAGLPREVPAAEASSRPRCEADVAPKFKKIDPKSGVEGRLPAKQSLPAWPSLTPDESFAMQPRGQNCSAPSSPPAVLPEPCSLFNKPYQESSSKISSSRGSAPNELDGKPRGRLLAAASCPQVPEEPPL